MEVGQVASGEIIHDEETVVILFLVSWEAQVCA